MDLFTSGCKVTVGNTKSLTTKITWKRSRLWLRHSVCSHKCLTVSHTNTNKGPRWLQMLHHIIFSHPSHLSQAQWHQRLPFSWFKLCVSLNGKVSNALVTFKVHFMQKDSKHWWQFQMFSGTCNSLIHQQQWLLCTSNAPQKKHFKRKAGISNLSWI